MSLLIVTSSITLLSSLLSVELYLGSRIFCHELPLYFAEALHSASCSCKLAVRMAKYIAVVANISVLIVTTTLINSHVFGVISWLLEKFIFLCDVKVSDR